MIELLRLSYWYFRCTQMDNANTLRFKETEMKNKLSEGLPHNLGMYVGGITYVSRSDLTASIYLSLSAKSS
jgi:hypothetical protein